ncbi:MAG: glycosyltransferase [bacterium]|nr:glycosyltransferase [bacterium]
MAKKKKQKRQKQKPTLSICLIAKDEAHFLSNCLHSVAGLADEMIVGDTGSSDPTVEVAQKRGARVVEVPWEGDFSKARNAVLDQARSDWILVLDCDEVLAKKDWGRIRQAMKRPGTMGYRMTTRNYAKAGNRVGWQVCVGEYDEEKTYPGWFPTTKVRLFRNDNRIRFEGVLHELVEGTIEAIGGKIDDCSVSVHHYGHVEKERPVAQYAESAKRKAKEDPENPEALYQLALSLRDANDWEGAQRAIEQCIARLDGKNERQGQYLRPDFVFLVQGEILSRLGDREAEEQAYLLALEQNADCYQALNNLGALKQKGGELEKALGYYEQALKLAPEVETVRENVERMKRQIGTSDEFDTPLPSGISQTRAKDGGRLSLCMIAGNEEARLGQCLESVQRLVDEIVVVDTGSTDRTVEIAKEYGAKLGYFEWCDDFAAARNASLKLATGDWIMWLDPDDVLPEECHAQIRAVMKEGLGKKVAYFFVLDDQGYEPVTCLQMRLFPNLPGIEFRMPIHEQVTPSLAEVGVRCEPTDIRVVHTGYTSPEVVSKKQQRYLGIMEKWLETHPEDYIVRSHAAMTYYVRGPIEKAVANYERILADGDAEADRNLVIQTTAELFLGRCYMREKAYETALAHLLKARELDDQYAVTNMTLGECYTRLKRPQEGLQALEQALKFEDQVTFSATDPAALRYSTRFFKAQNLEALGRLEEGAKWYRQASEADPKRSGALGGLSTVLRKLGRMVEAVHAIEAALERDPGHAQHRFNRGTFYLADGEEQEAERWFLRALEADPNMAEPYLNLGYIARKRGDAQAAEEMYWKAIERDGQATEPLANLGHLLLDQDRFSEAGELFERIRVQNPELLDINLGLGVVRVAEGNEAAVKVLLPEVLEAVYEGGLQMALPEETQAQDLAALFAESGRMLVRKQLIPCAKLGFQAAYLLYPQSLEYALLLAEVYQATGAAWKAVGIYEAQIHQNPTEPELFRKLGQCYRAMGVPDAARMCDEKVSQLEAPGGLMS